MTAVLGGDPDEVAAAIERHGLTAANINGAGQVVAAGTMEQLAALAGDPPAKARVIPLKVAGAFHTEHMAPAVERLVSLARAMSTHDPRTPLISNRDGQVVHGGREVLRRLVGQVSNPVRWDLTMETLASSASPGSSRSRPRAPSPVSPSASSRASRSSRSRPPTTSTAPARSARSTAWPPAGPGPDVAARRHPRQGHVLHPQRGREHDVVAAGGVVATVGTLRDTYEVVAPHGGRVVEWLVEDGDPVSPGQPLLRLHPQETDRCPSHHRRPAGAPHAGSPASAPTAPRASSPTPSSSRRSTPPTSGSRSAPASRPGASPVRARPSDMSEAAATPSRWPGSRPARSTPSSSRR